MTQNMGLTCEGPADPKAQRLYDDLVDQFGVPAEEFNQPVQTFYVRKGEEDYEVAARTLAASECRPSQQIYQRALRFVDQCHAETPTPLCRKIAERVNIHWFSPLSPSQPWKDFVQWRAEKIKAIEEKLHADPVDLAHHLVAAALQPKEQGGLGIIFDSSDKSPLRNIEQILTEGKATCLDFVTLCKALDIPDVTLVPVVLLQDPQGHSRLHMMAGITTDGSNNLVAIMDLSQITSALPEGFYFGPPRTGDVAGVVSDLKLFAEYRSREGAWQEGLSFDPFSDTINYNLANRLARDGNCDQVKALLDITRAANLLFPDLELPMEQCRLRTKPGEVSLRQAPIGE